MPFEREPTEERDREERALDRLGRRVRNVRHLGPFELSRKADGRFRCELMKPISALSTEEARSAADALEELAAAIREVAEERDVDAEE